MEFTIINQPRVTPHRSLYQGTKRFIDITIILISLPIVIPLLIFISLGIFISSPGPILFIQERIGRGGRSFRMYKFRTLKYNYDDRPYRSYMKAYVRGEFGQYVHNKETFKPAYDREITKIGHILRKTSLDELPQLINVLKGEMSIVGPRPNVSWEVDAYYYWHHERLEVLPGITGLAQVRGRSCIDFNTLVRYDIEYIENQSLLLDLKILWWTFTSVLFGKGAG